MTISQLDGFTEAGGMVQLITDGNRIRFAIIKKAVEKSGLKISSSLMRLAKIVD